MKNIFGQKCLSGPPDSPSTSKGSLLLAFPSSLPFLLMVGYQLHRRNCYYYQEFPQTFDNTLFVLCTVFLNLRKTIFVKCQGHLLVIVTTTAAVSSRVDFENTALLSFICKLIILCVVFFKLVCHLESKVHLKSIFCN